MLLWGILCEGDQFCRPVPDPVLRTTILWFIDARKLFSVSCQLKASCSFLQLPSTPWLPRIPNGPLFIVIQCSLISQHFPAVKH